MYSSGMLVDLISKMPYLRALSTDFLSRLKYSPSFQKPLIADRRLNFLGYPLTVISCLKYDICDYLYRQRANQR